MEKAMELHVSKQAIVIPILLRSCNWVETPFSMLQALPTDAKAISTWKDEDEAWLNVVLGLNDAIDEINERKSRKVAKNEFHEINNLLKTEITKIDSNFKMLADGGKPVGGIKTGLPIYDEYLDGLHLKEMTAISSRSEIVRSCFALQIASHVAINEKNLWVILVLIAPQND